MVFEPIGGYPPIVRSDDAKIESKTLESRGFSKTNIVNIGNIMDSNKKDNLFIAFGNEDEDGVNYMIENMLEKEPNYYNNIVYKEIPKRVSKYTKKN